MLKYNLFYLSNFTEFLFYFGKPDINGKSKNVY